MEETSEPSPAERRSAGRAASPWTTPAPGIVRRIGTPFGWRHVKGVAVTRWLVALWLVILGSIFCALGHWYWWGALLFPLAVLNAWLAYQMPRWKLALDTEKGVRLLR